MKVVVGSILHGAYGDLYEQALCLKHYAASHPEVELKLFAVTRTRLETFRALDLSFASVFALWPEIENHQDISQFFQFQVHDGELEADVLSKLSATMQSKIDRIHNRLPWLYLRDHKLIPAPHDMQLTLSEQGMVDLATISVESGVPETTASNPTVSFLWRYRKPDLGSISKFGQKSQAELVHTYSDLFKQLIERHDCHILIFGMNIITDDTNRELTDDKYPAFGLDLPTDRVTYMKGLSWILELEIASRATVCCGNASGFTEGLWLKRGRDMVLMNAPPHYLAKTLFRRMPLFNLSDPLTMAGAFLLRSGEHYGREIEAILKKKAKNAVDESG